MTEKILSRNHVSADRINIVPESREVQTHPETVHTTVKKKSVKKTFVLNIRIVKWKQGDVMLAYQFLCKSDWVKLRFLRKYNSRAVEHGPTVLVVTQL